MLTNADAQAHDYSADGSWYDGEPEGSVDQ